MAAPATPATSAMIAKSAAANKKFSPMLHYWKWGVKSNRKTLIILTVLHMIAAPAVFLSVIISVLSGHGLRSPDIYFGIGVVTTCVAGFMGIDIAVSSFDCLHKKSVVDMKLSLPMTSSQRFVSEFLSGLFTYMAPFLAAQVVSLLLAGFGLIFMEGRTFHYEYYSGGAANGDSRPYVCDFFSDATVVLLKLILCGILTMLMLYVLTVLITVCCGNKFECVSYSIGVNVVIPVTIFMVTMSVFDGLFGIDSEYSAVRTFMLTSPAGGFFAAVAWALEDEIYDFMHPALWTVLFFLVIAGLTSLSFFLYRKRRAEQVSKPFVFKLIYYIIVTGTMFCICSGFYMADSFIPCMIITAVIYFILEIVANRGFKRIWLSGIKYIVTVSMAFMLIFIGQETDGFGALWHVPASITVTSVEIDYQGSLNDLRVGSVILRDRGNIETVIEAHKKILDEYKTYLYSGESRSYFYRGVIYTDSLTIKYHLVGGGTLERDYYDIFTPAVVEILSGVEFTDEYKVSVAEYNSEIIRSWEERYNARVKNLSGREYYYDSYANYDVSLTRGIRNVWSFDGRSEVSMRKLCGSGFFDRLADAYVHDIMEITESNYTLNNANQYYVYWLDAGFETIVIPASFENTHRLLYEYGFDIANAYI